jgi:hypothetical protein
MRTTSVPRSTPEPPSEAVRTTVPPRFTVRVRSVSDGGVTSFTQ